MPVHSALYVILLFISSKAAPARADAVSLIAARRKEPSPTTPSASDADQSVAFEKAFDSGEARCLVSNQLLYISKRHCSLHEQDETNNIKSRAEQSSKFVSSTGPFTKYRIERTDAWSVEKVGKDEEGDDKSAEGLQYAILRAIPWVGGGRGEF